MDSKEKKTTSNPIALLPIGVFLLLYLGLGVIFEYIMKIEMGFYSIPIVVVFIAFQKYFTQGIAMGAVKG